MQQVPSMQPTDWGNPQKVSVWRDAVMKYEPYYAKNPDQVDQFIAGQQKQYSNQIGGQAVYQAQGGVTTGQAGQNPLSAGQYLMSGGNLINSGPDAQSIIINKAGQDFKAKANKKGYVDPNLYNTYLQQFSQAGGNTDDFNKKFETLYVDPNNIKYDTPDSLLARKSLPLIKNVIDSYHNLHMTGANVENLKALENVPIIGPLIKQKVLSAQDAHDQFLIAQAGNIRDIAGAGPNQGFRFNLNELNNITNLLPKAEDSRLKASEKLNNLDNFLKSNMGVSLKDIYGK